MRLAVQINQIASEPDFYTTTHLMRLAADRGHTVVYLQLGDWTYDEKRRLTFRGRQAPAGTESAASFVKQLNDEASEDIHDMETFDVLLLRDNPADEGDRPWAKQSSLKFPYLAKQSGVLVLNDPISLMWTAEKLYAHSLPEWVQPRTLISRDVEQIREFVQRVGKSVIKPLAGSQGRNVFYLEAPTDKNFNQIVEVVEREGYVLVQEFIKEAAEGDIRLFMLQGKPMQVNGKYAAILRQHAGSDWRNNITLGGKGECVALTEAQLHLAHEVGRYLIKDHLFFAGLDIAGDKLIEINVATPGGLELASELWQEDFIAAFLDALEDEVADSSSQPQADGLVQVLQRLPKSEAHVDRNMR